MRVIALMNQKGGVGKTTTAVNLSACLATAKQPTLLVDCDSQANTTAAIGFAKDPSRRTRPAALLSGTGGFPLPIGAHHPWHAAG